MDGMGPVAAAAEAAEPSRAVSLGRSHRFRPKFGAFEDWRNSSRRNCEMLLLVAA